MAERGGTRGGFGTRGGKNELDDLDLLLLSVQDVKVVAVDPEAKVAKAEAGVEVTAEVVAEVAVVNVQKKIRVNPGCQ